MSTLEQEDVPPMSGSRMGGRCCFVTVGATASFRPLLEKVLSPAFLDHLAAKGFSLLLVQTGPDQDWAGQTVDELQTQHRDDWPAIETFSYAADVAAKMLPCRGEPGRQLSGVMISHAGSGSILDAARMDVPLVVVPNGALLGNHQEELADAVDAAGWAIRGHLESLSEAITRTLALADQQLAKTPYHEPEFPTAEADRSGLFDFAALAASQPLVDLDQLD